MNNLKRIGSIFLNNEVLISDPCYETDCKHNVLIDGIENGLYNCFVEISDEGEWGKRVARMVAIHKDYDISVLDEYAFDDKFIIAFGSEANGISEEIRQISDEKITISMDNNVESLNLGVCASVVFAFIRNKNKSK